MTKEDKHDLIVPVILWGSQPPKHKISQIAIIQNGTIIITGSDEGQLIQWKVENGTIEPNMFLLGHDAAITCLASASDLSTSTRYISCCRKGQICLWDSSDGSCVETVKHSFVHRKIIPYTSSTQSVSQLYCIGDYADIVVIDANDLNILFTLCSRVDPDWINAFTIVKRLNSRDAIYGISISGMIKIWSLSDTTKTEHQNIIYEDEAKSLPIKNVKSISCSNKNPKIMFIISSSSWHILDINSFIPLIISECSIEAIDGTIIDTDKIAVGFIDGTIALFQLPKHRVTEASNNVNSAADHPFVFGLLKSFEPSINTYFINAGTFLFDTSTTIAGDSKQIFAYRGDGHGNIAAFKCPDNMDLLVKDVIQNKKPAIFGPSLQQSLKKIWENNKSALPGIYNTDTTKITSTLYIPNQGKLLLGCEDGKILLTNACEAIKSQFSSPANPPPPHRILSGHSSAVTCFIYPFEESSRYDSNIFISGGKDFCVISWNLTTGSKLHCFCSQGGIIQRLLIPPDNCNPRILHTICSIADDNSAALLSLKENKCILLASRQIFPIIDIHWRPLDDLMMVRCADDSLYVWQMETANLDRIVTGLIAEDVIEGCKEQIGIFEYDDEAGANQATQMLRAIKNKNLAAVKKIAGKTDTNLHMTKESQTHHSKPLKIIPLKKCSNQAHLLLFNVNDIFKEMNTNDSDSRSSSFQLSLSSLISAKARKVSVTPRNEKFVAKTVVSEIAKLLLSFIFDWSDNTNTTAAIKRGMFKPSILQHFGIVSSNSSISLYMPSDEKNIVEKVESKEKHVHWESSNTLSTSHLSSTLITSHLIANIALSNALAITSSYEQRDLANELLNKVMPPRIQLLAEKWQDPCIEIRSASQILLLQELHRIGVNGRKKLINEWSPFIPVLLDSSLSILGKAITSNNIAIVAAAASNLSSCADEKAQTSTISMPPSRPPPPIPPRQTTDTSTTTINDQQLSTSNAINTPSTTPESDTHLSPIHGGIHQIRQNQAIAIVLLGVIGTEFGNEFNQANNTAVRATALSLFELLIAPETSSLPIDSTLRQCAVDLIGGGFLQWQPHLDLSKLLLALLHLASLEEIKNIEITLIAKNSLSLITSICPKAVIIALSTEVTRYNSLHQTTQLSIVSPLIASKSDVLRIFEKLIESHYSDVVELVIPVCDILIHCLDLQQLKHQNFYDLFPPIAKLYMIAYCPATKKLAIGGSSGAIVIHELKSNMKSQTIQAHNNLISSIAFSSDGKFLAVYSAGDAKITIWQTHQTFLGMGQSQMRLIKTMEAPGKNSCQARLAWIGAKMLKLLFSNGTESVIQI